MDSINIVASPNYVSHSIKASSKYFDQLKEGFSLGNKNFPGRSAEGELQELNLANKVPIISQPSPWKEAVGHRNHVAWTSVRQHRWEGELVVEGEIPLWLNGIYLRNGPGIWHVGDHNFGHLFDGFAMVVKLQFENGRLMAGHRQIESEAYKAAMKHNKLIYQEFSEAPRTDNFLSYMGKLAGLISGASLTDNANVGVVKLGDGPVVCFTETQKGSIIIDPTTLETLGKFEYADFIWGPLQSSHPIVTDTEFLAVFPDLINPGYLVVRMEQGSNERKVIGRVECRGDPRPGWVHSFAITEHYVVVPEMPMRYNLKKLFKAQTSLLYPFEWYPESKGFVHVMCKASGKIVASVEVPLYMAFHFINAYEEMDQDGRVVAVIADCCEYYGDGTILDKLSLHNIRSFAGQDVFPNSRIGRFTIPLDGSPLGNLETVLDPNEHGRGIDICNINRAFLGKKHRFVYACGTQRPCNFPNTLTKVDLVEKQAKNWHEDGAVPSEPFFVARPGATEEDDGVVISIISEKNGGGYALLLDGSTFEEIARAKLPYGLPYGFHGCWIPKK